jgi:dephospho-CoA kinase
MLRVGLTGGIASGKSFVAGVMRELGCYVLDADRMAHRLIEPGQAAYDGVVQEFGRDILDAEGRVVRPKLAEIVFADPARLARLNAIVHPHILAALDVELDWLSNSDAQGVAVVEAALLVESGYYARLERLIVVWCTPEQQLERLVNERGMTIEQARQRIASQMSLEEKRGLADDEIDCSGTREHTREQVVALVERLKQMAVAAPSEPEL